MARTDPMLSVQLGVRLTPSLLPDAASLPEPLVLDTHSRSDQTQDMTYDLRHDTTNKTVSRAIPSPSARLGNLRSLPRDLDPVSPRTPPSQPQGGSLQVPTDKDTVRYSPELRDQDRSRRPGGAQVRHGGDGAAATAHL